MRDKRNRIGGLVAGDKTVPTVLKEFKPKSVFNQGLSAQPRHQHSSSMAAWQHDADWIWRHACACDRTAV